MKKIVLLAILSTLIQGCTSIVQPTASRTLVENEFVTSITSVDPSLSSALTDTKAGKILEIGQQPTVLGDSFFAATGLTCRKLTSQQTGLHIYCLNIQGNWFKVKKVISEYNENYMPRAGL
ncbi:MAG: hypothetical protein ACI9J4_000768 [Paraglaciecola sp.]|jgi:hypothetical protein